MGYRSYVKGGFVFKTKEQRDVFYAAAVMAIREEYKSEDADILQNDLRKFTCGELFGYRYEYEDVKWYGGWVEFFEALNTIAIEQGGAWCFARTGENHDDIEYEYDDFDGDLDVYDMFQPVTYIESDWNMVDEA
jgi:hypothetical protein